MRARVALGSAAASTAALMLASDGQFVAFSVAHGSAAMSKTRRGSCAEPLPRHSMASPSQPHSSVAGASPGSLVVDAVAALRAETLAFGASCVYHFACPRRAWRPPRAAAR